MAEYLQYITSLNQDLIKVLQQFGIFIVIIACMSCFFTQAIKKSDDEIFLNGNLSSIHIWIINLVFSLLVSAFMVIVFDGLDSIFKTITYIFLNWVCGWIASVLVYDYILRYLFDFLEIIEIKIEMIKKNLEIEYDNLSELSNKEKLKKSLESLTVDSANDSIDNINSSDNSNNDTNMVNKC